MEGTVARLPARILREWGLIEGLVRAPVQEVLLPIVAVVVRRVGRAARVGRAREAEISGTL